MAKGQAEGKVSKSASYSNEAVKAVKGFAWRLPVLKTHDLEKIGPGLGVALAAASALVSVFLEDTMIRRPVDTEEELCWMSQEVRGYVEAGLNSLAANVPKVVVPCQVEKAKEDMLNQMYNSVR